MADFRIEIDGDTIGHVGWRLTAVHNARDNEDADAKDMASVLEELNEFAKQLKVISQEAE